MPATISGLNNIVPSSVTAASTTPTINSTTGTVTFSSATSPISILGVFSATYDNYLINIDGYQGGSYPMFRLRTASTIDSTNYWWHTQWIYGATSTYSNSGTTASTTGIQVGYGASQMDMRQIHIASPFLAERTVLYYEGMNPYSNATIMHGVGHHNVASSFTGFTLDFPTVSFSGYITVYGFTK